MTGLTNLGIILTSIFTLLFLALIAELIYLYIIRQRRHRRLTATTTTTTTSINPLPPTCGNLKSIFLNFLSWKTQSRIEPSTTTINQPSPTDPEMSAEDIEIAELLKLQNSRLLFTIREEEREGIDSSATERSSSVGERRNRRNNVRSKSTSLDFAVGGGGGSATSFSASVESPEVCLVVVVEGNESNSSDEGHMTMTTSYQSLQNSSSSCCSTNTTTTPYSTPCQSPVAYFTPPGSPSRVVRDTGGGISSDGGGWWSA